MKSKSAKTSDCSIVGENLKIWVLNFDKTTEKPLYMLKVLCESRG